MPIPQSERASVADEKVRDYLLNLDHPEGGSKAVWFHSLGYDRSQWRFLAYDLLLIAHRCAEFETETSPHGIKYIASGHAGRPGHQGGVVLTVWIVEDEDPPRLVTAYPDDAK